MNAFVDFLGEVEARDYCLVLSLVV